MRREEKATHLPSTPTIQLVRLATAWTNLTCRSRRDKNQFCSTTPLGRVPSELS